MTDRDALLALCDRFGITPSLFSPSPDAATRIEWEAHRSGPRVDGYGSFVVTFEFTPEGEFVKVGIWE